MAKGSPQREQFVQGSSPWEPTAKTDKKEKISKPQIGRQIPLEMGTGGGGGGDKKGGNGNKRPPEDKIDIENHPGEGEEDNSSSETSLELNLDPQQLASVRFDRPLLKLRLMPRRRIIIATAPGGGGTPPPTGGGTVTVPLPERQNSTGTNQPIKGGGGPPQPPNGVGGGTGPLLSERGRIPQQPAGGGGALPPGGNGNGNGNGNGRGDRPPPQGEMAVMAMMMEMVVEMIHHHRLVMDSHDTIEVKEIDGCMLFKDHLDPQVNLDKMVEMVRMDKHHSCPEE